MSDQADTVTDLVARISPILSGHPPEVQSAALADLTSMWLAGMQDLDNPESADVQALRNELFAAWIKMVFDLVPVNVRILRERYFGKPQ